ncbi:uncharacterized protein K452DRAFT_312225 [Aplosporella prunicola CBS 121167]|uniref:Uncharacterized protein n=1 Tax=Aplosporella prunicola CBS 121167 TaxID=1176127 RepID=A0A6A6B0B7_9PEZI|nr:uncharacterized protein K452DRAFT_312225 [Aplosporella prunicola CBS 121167]KAF2137619.1 hypothetical protein K452DRAFT_312225 [Aplosporella prunicola CBS 121167]
MTRLRLILRDDGRNPAASVNTSVATRPLASPTSLHRSTNLGQSDDDQVSSPKRPTKLIIRGPHPWTKRAKYVRQRVWREFPKQSCVDLLERFLKKPDLTSDELANITVILNQVNQKMYKMGILDEHQYRHMLMLKDSIISVRNKSVLRTGRQQRRVKENGRTEKARHVECCQ